MSTAELSRGRRYGVLGSSSWAGATIARRLSAGSSLTSKGTFGLIVIALFTLAGSIWRVKSRLRYAAGSTVVSPLAGVAATSAGGPSVVNVQWCLSEYVLPARSR